MKPKQLLTPYTEINSKWIKDLNKRPAIIKGIEEIMGDIFCDINNKNIYSDPVPIPVPMVS